MRAGYCRVVLLGLVLGLAHSDARAACDPALPATTPDERFIIDAAADLVTDKVTGLVWQRCSVGQSGSDCSSGSAINVNWPDALQAAQDSTVAGYTDWRLPNAKELASIIEFRCYGPTVNSSVFPGTLSGSYWSSSPQERYNNFARMVSFHIGYVYQDIKSRTYHVRLVRGGL